MAQKVVLVDDIDGTEGVDHTVLLAFEGETVKLDLGTKNYEKLKKLLLPYLEAGEQVKEEPVKRGRGASRGSSSGTSAERTEALRKARAWLQSNGHQVGDKGKIAQDLLDIYVKETKAVIPE